MPFAFMPTDHMLDLVEVGVMVHAADTTIVYANNAAGRFFGVAREHLVGNKLPNGWDLRTLEGASIAHEDLPVPVAVKSKRAVRNAVVGLVRPDVDEVAWLRVDAFPLVDGEHVEHVVVTFTDVSDEHRRASAEMRARVASEERHAAVLRVMSEGVAVHDASGAITFCNPAAERIMGLKSSAAARGETWSIVTPSGEPLPRERLPSEITRRTGQPCRDVVLGIEIGADRKLTWFSVSTAAIPGGSAEHGHAVVTTFTDITAQHEAQVELARSNARFAGVIAALPGVLYQSLRTNDGVFKVTYVAGETKAMTGLTKEEFYAGRMRDIIHPDDLAAALGTIAVDPHRPFQTEFRVRSGAEWRWLRVRSSSTKVDAGVMFTGVMLDISEEKRLAASLARAQLRDALGDLAAGMAHNFNNMLAALLPSLVELREHIAPEGRAPLEDALGATRRAADLVRQLMRLARGDTDGAPQPVDLRALVSEVVTLCQRTFDRSIHIVARLHLDGEAVTREHASQLHQAVLNLCLNARDALEGRRAPRLDITLERDGAHHVVVVQDNGRGMDDATLQQLGQPFFTTKPPGRGTGLGVATAMRVVREMGGELTIESKVDHGTTVRVRVPATSDRVVKRDSEMPKMGVRPRVLLVEDEPLVRRVVARVIGQIAEKVEVAEDGDAALGLIDRGPPFDVVVLDLSMPGMPGRVVLQEIKRRKPDLPVVIMSGNVGTRDGLDGAAAVIEKPISPSELSRVIAGVLNPSASSRAGSD